MPAEFFEIFFFLFFFFTKNIINDGGGRVPFPARWFDLSGSDGGRGVYNSSSFGASSRGKAELNVLVGTWNVVTSAPRGPLKMAHRP